MSSKIHIDIHDVVKRRLGILSSTLGEDLIIFMPDRGNYFGTSEVGKSIWDMTERPVKVLEICESLGKNFEVDRTTCEHQVLRFVNELLDNGLLECVEDNCV